LALSAGAQDPRIAQEVFEMGNYFEAIEQYTRLIEKEPNNAIYNANLGLSYLRTNIEPTKALDYLLKVEQIGEHKDILYLEIARAYTFHLQYDESLLYLEKYAKSGKLKKDEKLNYERLKANCYAALDLMKYPVDVEFKNLGKEINSEYADYHPFLSNDGKFIVFTSRRKVRPGSRPEFDGYYPSDIYVSDFQKYEWDDADRLNDRINTVYDEQSVGITKSGDSLFFYMDHVDDYGDLFVTIRNGSTYSRPERIASVNTEAVESACSV
jgi:tetratricopeptide (TPR) repeat protein